VTAEAAPAPVIGCGVLRVDGFVCVCEDCDGTRHFFVKRQVCACGVAVADDKEMTRHKQDCYIE
jgi:hypothetical protein